MMKKHKRGAVIAVCLVILVVSGVSYGAWSTITTLLTTCCHAEHANVPAHSARRVHTGDR
jgi:hypothetical protein